MGYADEYCVLGADCRYLDVHFSKKHPNERFPGAQAASEALGISLSDAMYIASYNDRGDFEHAWYILEEALQKRKTQ